MTYERDTRLGVVHGALVTAAQGDYHGGSTPELIAGVAARFAAAFAADPSAAMGLAGPNFDAYSMSERATGRFFVAYLRSQLADLLRARGVHHERQHMLALLVKPKGHVVLVGLRVADDYPAGDAGRVRVFIGKGKVHCESASIEALNAVDEGGTEVLVTAAVGHAGTPSGELHTFAQPIITELSGARTPELAGCRACYGLGLRGTHRAAFPPMRSGRDRGAQSSARAPANAMRCRGRRDCEHGGPVRACRPSTAEGRVADA